MLHIIKHNVMSILLDFTIKLTEHHTFNLYFLEKNITQFFNFNKTKNIYTELFIYDTTFLLYHVFDSIQTYQNVL